MSNSRVMVRREPFTIPTYSPLPADKNPMFLENRVYQGSSGKVYPLPFIDRIAEEKADFTWDAIHLENDYLLVTILPQIGGRIHVGFDKTINRDFLYRQNVIKPALVGLAGPWISGGIELNWPQHHRPSTFLPVDTEIEESPDGSVTVWLSEHEPMNRMKGMHGVCLSPDRSSIELRVRLYNRTEFVQTFLWWANFATCVHEQYQSFLPADVYNVADHAKRAVIDYPLCTGSYYGVDYALRAANGVPVDEAPPCFVPNGEYAPNDLSWYANIPVPTSYMALGSKEDHFGGYDHKTNSGVVHVANHHISPGKKQWTWGNHPFGYAWDRNLTDADGPYIELMAGVYTDNQPDFSFLAPGETRTFSQFWYPIKWIGRPKKANQNLAVNLTVEGEMITFAVFATTTYASVSVLLQSKSRTLTKYFGPVSPASPIIKSIDLPEGLTEDDISITVLEDDVHTLIHYSPVNSTSVSKIESATEPALPRLIDSLEELYLTGLHLEQYRHATRRPEEYWQEALRRDPSDARSNNALGLWRLRRGEFTLAEAHFLAAIDRLTERNPNPYDGEPFYNLGLTLRYLDRDQNAYDAFYKSTWNRTWQGPAYHAIAEIDCKRGDWQLALEHIVLALKSNVDDLKARDLQAVIYQNLAKPDAAAELLNATLAIDPLDHWARLLHNGLPTCNTQVRLDIALDCIQAGLYTAAIHLLESAVPEPNSGTAPMVHYYLGWIYHLTGDSSAALSSFQIASNESSDYCFPARLKEITILTEAFKTNPEDAKAAYYLGCLYYDRRRHEDAISLWKQSTKIDPNFATVWRCLGIGLYNIEKDSDGARIAYDHAMRLQPDDARICYERDQLWKRIGVHPRERLEELSYFPDLVALRDDLSLELAALHNQTGAHAKALAIVEGRHFQPWEGGEGTALGQHVRTQLALGRIDFETDDFQSARDHFVAALTSPQNLGEAKHLLANDSDVRYWLGRALSQLGDFEGARREWYRAASFRGDFQEMSVRPFSEMTYYSALSMRELGNHLQATETFASLLNYAEELKNKSAKIDYFATSLPTLLLFNEDLQRRQLITSKFLSAQANLGLGNMEAAEQLIADVLTKDPSHPAAADLSAAFLHKSRTLSI